MNLPQIFPALLAVAPFAHASTLMVGSAEDFWVVVPGKYDFADDQQTGLSDADIVGDELGNYGFFTGFREVASKGGTDGELAFRVRLNSPGGNRNNPSFERVLWVGIDADMSGALDVFLAVNRQGSSDSLEIYGAEGGSNTSPGTLSFSKDPFYSEAISTSNFNYRAVDPTIDGGTTNDVGLNGDDDHYLSFAMPLQKIADYLITREIEITDRSPLRYVLATATQTNRVNQDIGAVEGGLDSEMTWEELGAFTREATASTGVVPEPHPPLLGLVTAGLLTLRRGRVIRRA